jgi:hypothetical protein
MHFKGAMEEGTEDGMVEEGTEDGMVVEGTEDGVEEGVEEALLVVAFGSDRGGIPGGVHLPILIITRSRPLS